MWGCSRRNTVTMGFLCNAYPSHNDPTHLLLQDRKQNHFWATTWFVGGTCLRQGSESCQSKFCNRPWRHTFDPCSHDKSGIPCLCHANLLSQCPRKILQTHFATFFPWTPPAAALTGSRLCWPAWSWISLKTHLPSKLQSRQRGNCRGKLPRAACGQLLGALSCLCTSGRTSIFTLQLPWLNVLPERSKVARLALCCLRKFGSKDCMSLWLKQQLRKSSRQRRACGRRQR